MASYAGCAGLGKVATAGPDTILGTADDIEIPTPKLVNVLISAVLTDLTGAKKPNPFSTSTSDPTGKTAVFHASNAVQGFPGGASTAAADARTALGTSTSYTLSTTPILYVAGGAAQAVPLSAIAAILSTTITLASDTYKWNNNPTNTVMLIADCKNSEMFRAASTTTTGVITTETPLLNAYGSDAIVTPLLTSTYFLATRTGASTPSLYRRYFNGNTSTVEELVPNVEAITFQYGLNTTNNATGDPTYQPDSYVLDTDAAFATMDWSRVVSVRMGLIVVTEDANQTSSNGGTVPWVGGNYTPASSTDRRLRRAYSTTVSIRNRMGL